MPTYTDSIDSTREVAKRQATFLLRKEGCRVIGGMKKKTIINEKIETYI